MSNATDPFRDMNGKGSQRRFSISKIVALGIWAIFVFVLPFFADLLNGVTDFLKTATIVGFPLGFYTMAQVAPIVFVGLLFFLTRSTIARPRNDNRSVPF